jgi:uncharacterized membrane protein YfcA
MNFGEDFVTQSSVEIALSIFVGFWVSCAMVLALREGAVRLRNVLITLSAGIAGAILGSTSVQMMPMAKHNLLVLVAAAAIVGALAAVLAEIVTTPSGTAGSRATNGSDQAKKRSAHSALIEKTIVRLRETHRSADRTNEG